MKAILLVVLNLCLVEIYEAAVKTVNTLNLEQYAGVWYQVYTDLTVIRSIQPDAMCVKTNYSIHNNQTLLVHETFRKWSPHGEPVERIGNIIQPNIALPGELRMKYDEMPYANPYLVIKLGPVSTITDQYQYAIVTDMNKGSLYIYARCVHDFRKDYKDEALKFCHDNGFKSYYNEPKETPQPTSCQYLL